MKTIYILLLILSCCLVGCQQASSRQAAEQSLHTLVVEVQPNEQVLFFKARIEPLKETNLSSPIDGVVDKLHFTYGQRVTQGQVLLVVKSEQLQKDYQDALAGFLKAKVDYQNQNIKSRGLEELWKIQAISHNQYIEEKQQIANYYLTYRQAEQRLKELVNKIHSQNLAELMRLNINDIKAVEQALGGNAGELRVIAPSAGVALYPDKTGDDNIPTHLLEGSSVKSGQGLLKIGDMSGLALYINVNEVDVNTIQPGQKVSITGVAFPDITLHGEVKEVDIQAKSNSASGLPTFPVKIVAPQVSAQALAKIHVGMSAEVKLSISQPAAIKIPLAALVKQDGKTLAKIIDPKTGQPRPIEVVVGNTSLNDVTIVKGLQPGDKLVLPH